MTPVIPQREVIIVGSGIAGLYCALWCAQHSKVRLITKNKIVESSSSYAQGGIAAVLDDHDSFQRHIQDTLAAGAQHNKRSAVEVLVKEAPQHIASLIQLGVDFSLNPSGTLDLGREGGHTNRRIVHAKDMTGLAVERALIAAVKRHKNIHIQQWEFALDLIKDRKKIVGVRTVKKNYYADAVILATGGAGQMYPYTSNPTVVTGDGIAMAMRAGAKAADMEFVQFHPTAYYIPGKRPFLLSEALRGEGAYLRNVLGNRFVNELKPRDYVSRAVYRQQRQGLVYLDFRHAKKTFLQQRFPGIYQQLSKDHLMLERDLIPITPVAHYFCGGIKTDLYGRSSLPGLYVIGEAAQTGVHGANRLASNSLLECLVFGYRAAQQIKKLVPNPRRPKTISKPYRLVADRDDTYIGLRQQLQNVMWEAGGIVRTRAGLTAGLAEIRIIHRILISELKRKPTLLALELSNLATVGEAVLAAALKRRISLGCHYRVN